MRLDDVTHLIAGIIILVIYTKNLSLDNNSDVFCGSLLFLYLHAATKQLYKLELPTMTFESNYLRKLFANLSEKRRKRVLKRVFVHH